MHLPRSLAALSTALLLAATMPQLGQARELVGFSDSYSSGTVVVKTSERALYYVLGNGKAVRYPVGVGRAGRLISYDSQRRQPARQPRAELSAAVEQVLAGARSGQALPFDEG
jgi:lipoprotein-anchoring transpeptidase ErfK/SrfK